MAETYLVTGAVSNQLATLDGIVFCCVIVTFVCYFEKRDYTSNCACGKQATRIVLSERVEGRI